VSHIPYIDRTRTYYSALGYSPYAWAEHDDVPFAALGKPLGESRLALITTAAPYRAELDDQGPGAAYNAEAKFFEVYECGISPTPNLRISHLGYDRIHSMAEDPATWLPIAQLQAAAQDGRIGSLASRLIGVPTNRSQRITSEQDAPAALEACLDQQADIALLVPS